MDDSLLSKFYMGFEVGSEEAISYTLALKETCRKYRVTSTCFIMIITLQNQPIFSSLKKLLLLNPRESSLPQKI